MTAFDRWEASARLALSERGIGYHEATPLIDEARQHCAESCESPWRAIGAPADFAADVAGSRPAEQALRDTRGKTPRDYLGDALFGLAALGIPVAVVGAIGAGSLTIPVTVAGLAGSLVACLAAVVAWAGPGALRASGHPRLAPWSFALCAVLGGLAGVAFIELPRERVGGLPAVVLLAVSVGACWLLTRPSRAVVPTDGDSEDGPEEAEAWFARLDALLVGRFDVAPARASELVAETRAHVLATGGRPRDEFPSLAGYARDLAEGEPVRPGPWWRSSNAGLLATLGVGFVFGVQTVEAALNGPWWLMVCGVLAMVMIINDVRGRLRSRRSRRSRAVASS
ncbi:hypothetical protein [Actinoplanes sp. NPDC026670]|uniref:hypothetical protein n=1 Tax=Actinoplanes sp. NPDC026670 TaxID=3154700 RepID=UPI0033FBB2AD